MNEANRVDPMCEQKGSVKGVADMLNGGMSLDTRETWDRWPKDLHLLMYHGGDDQICDPEATKRFFAGVLAPHKKLEIIEVSLSPFQDYSADHARVCGMRHIMSWNPLRATSPKWSANGWIRSWVTIRE